MALLSFDIVEDILEVADKYSAKQHEVLDRRADAQGVADERVPAKAPIKTSDEKII